MPRKKSGDFDKLKYIQEFDKKKYKKILVRIPYDDVDIINKLDQVKSKNGYILELIKKDIKKLN